jgi:hypothetical protein
MYILVILFIFLILSIYLTKEKFSMFPKVINPSLSASDLELDYCKNSIISIDEDIDLNQTLFSYRPKRIVYSKSKSSNSL